MYALEPMTLRTRVALLLVFAALFALGPVLHNHPLSSDLSGSAAPCTACVSQIARVAPPPPAVVAPVVVVYTIVAQTASMPSAAAPLILPSRAPPAA